ncbi:hypothetical protein ASPZODRAFT_132141 [Penicilliopsis zonata CBS 506.65]|uniref:Up-regulated during septation protein 1 domain-containing protein n=1 Tax=Penicilliopsis zonata CBS 506.65 TaxID=1073090 RepID=A0A1L9SJ99_9EURO|nr:hypothetical protein ASPZODRAFT_132141 [Penicilliopsis zonata CBS 506.65]OJJ47181.1 hypothetical protein ASPZODRAFT_132141 [Penicilliopsis zonata CBS 506.65]
MIKSEQRLFDGSESKGRASPERPGYQIWPTMKKVLPSLDMKSPRMGMSRDKRPCQSSSGSQDARTFLPAGKPKGSSLLPQQLRIGSAVAPMATVQEDYMDSPTIPGMSPVVHERSLSAPEASRTQPVANKINRKPVPTPANMKYDAQLIRSYDNPPTKPITNCINIPVRSDSLRLRIKDEITPEVPPKSPRTSDMTARLPQMLPASRYQPPSSPERPVAASRHHNPPSKPVPPRPERRPEGDLPKKMPQSSDSGLAAQTSKADGTVFPYYDDDSASDVDSVISYFEESDQFSHENNGSQLDSISPRTSCSSATTVASATLPAGYVPSHAAAVMAPTEMDTIYEQAKKQARTFQVLKCSDVSELSRELQLMEERCDYLRTTYEHLREGRQHLHGRMIGLLKSPRLSATKDTLLKQEQALLDLNSAIDDWLVKLEAAENRRSRIQQKLLEHFAAALLSQAMTTEPSPAVQGTPPSSPPGEMKSGKNTIDDRIASITVFADSKIYGNSRASELMADIEEAMDQMKQNIDAVPASI